MAAKKQAKPDAKKPTAQKSTTKKPLVRKATAKEPAAGPSEVRHKVRTDPHLKKLLQDRESDDETIEVVCTLRQPEAEKFLEPEETERIAKEVLCSAERQAESKPRSVNVFRNLQSFAVSGSRSFVRKLLEDQAIESAIANQQPDRNAYIPPVNKRPVD